MKKLLLLPILTLIHFAVFADDLTPKKNSPDNKKVKSLMLVGNSFFYYNNSLHKYIGDIVKHDDFIDDLKKLNVIFLSSQERIIRNALRKSVHHGKN